MHDLFMNTLYSVGIIILVCIAAVFVKGAIEAIWEDEVREDE